MSGAEYRVIKEVRGEEVEEWGPFKDKLSARRVAEAEAGGVKLDWKSKLGGKLRGRLPDGGDVNYIVERV